VGAKTVPLTLVVPPSQLTCRGQRFVQGGVPPPQTLGTPAPPQISGAVQDPHWRIPPQPSATGPQFEPACWQVLGVQGAPFVPHTLAVPPPPQMSGAVQVPHWSVPPQPSPIGPQFAPTEAHVLGTHTVPASAGAPQTFGTPPPPQVPLMHEPQSRRRPQPSATGPHVAPMDAHVAGTHCDMPPQTLGIPPPPQVSGAVHVPQSRVPPQPSPACPHWTPSEAQVMGVQLPLPGVPHTFAPAAPQL
jgi:hypothetical protein